MSTPAERIEGLARRIGSELNMMVRSNCSPQTMTADEKRFMLGKEELIRLYIKSIINETRRLDEHT